MMANAQPENCTLEHFACGPKVYSFNLLEPLCDVLANLAPTELQIFLPFNEKKCIFLTAQIGDMNDLTVKKSLKSVIEKSKRVVSSTLFDLGYGIADNLGQYTAAAFKKSFPNTLLIQLDCPTRFKIKFFQNQLSCDSLRCWDDLMSDSVGFKFTLYNPNGVCRTFLACNRVKSIQVFFFHL